MKRLLNWLVNKLLGGRPDPQEGQMLHTIGDSVTPPKLVLIGRDGTLPDTWPKEHPTWVIKEPDPKPTPRCKCERDWCDGRYYPDCETALVAASMGAPFDANRSGLRR